MHGMRSLFLQDESAKCSKRLRWSAGLDYPGVGRSAMLAAQGRASTLRQRGAPRGVPLLADGGIVRLEPAPPSVGWREAGVCAMKG